MPPVTGFTPSFLVTRTFNPNMNQGASPGWINTDWVFKFGGNTPYDTAYQDTDIFYRAPYVAGFSANDGLVYNNVDFVTAPTACRISADIRMNRPHIVGGVPGLYYAATTTIGYSHAFDPIYIKLTGGDGSTNAGTAVENTLTIQTSLGNTSIVLPFQVKVYDGNPFNLNQAVWYRVGLEKYGRSIRAYVDPTARVTPYGQDDQLVNYLSILNNLGITKSPLGSYQVRGAYDTTAANITLDYSGFAEVVCQELQYIETGGTRPPGLPSFPINLPSGGELAAPVDASSPFNPVDLSLTDYHRYKNVRTAMAIYGNIRLDQ